MLATRLHTGDTATLGATVMDGGVNFALYSEHAEAVELCLFDQDGVVERDRLSMHACPNGIWAGFLPNAKPGQIYGYRVHGSWAPHLGHRFNPHKLLLDPWAKELATPFKWSDRHFAYQRVGDQVVEGEQDTRDNADVMAKGRVVADSAVDTGKAPDVPWCDTVFYETHVKGFTREWLDLPASERGTFDGLAAPAALDYLKALGITSLELLPVHAIVDEHHLHRLGLKNYWGYNTLSFFAPHLPYLGREGADSIRRFVRAAHDRGIEVILDVVYNHTCEGGHMGPTLSFRGIDNKSYYRLSETDPRHYSNETGCGNVLENSSSIVQRLVLESLAHWRESYGIDGFRFDLAPVLGSRGGHFDPDARMVQRITSAPSLGNAKLVAEPWSAVGEGYSLGRFPKGWAEWNDKARDTFRGFWQSGGGVTLAEFAQRLSGSGDLYHAGGRGPNASINMIACHDGFTLADATQYSHKHNHANGEANRDGHNHNICDNFGHEGPSPDLAIRMLRARRRRSLLGTVFLAAGTPLLLGGDEFGRSQMGNNNAYCQDNSANWLDWSLAQSGDGADLVAFTRYLIDLRHKLRHFDRNHYLPSAELEAVAGEDSDAGIMWQAPDGEKLTDHHWHDAGHRAFAKLVIENGPESDIREGALFMAFNAGNEPVTFTVPEVLFEGRWHVALDTGRAVQPDEPEALHNQAVLEVEPGAMALLVQGNVWR